MKKSDIKISYPVTMNRKIPVISGIVIIFLVIIDLLMTRQILSYSNDTEALLCLFLTVIIGFGIGSWILLRYTRKISQEIRSKSHFINLMYWTVTITQFSLLGILLFVLFSNTMGILSPGFCYQLYCSSIIMGVIAFKFFWWYKLSDIKESDSLVLRYRRDIIGNLDSTRGF